jgi:competence protein ComEC
MSAGTIPLSALPSTVWGALPVTYPVETVDAIGQPTKRSLFDGVFFRLHASFWNSRFEAETWGHPTAACRTLPVSRSPLLRLSSPARFDPAPVDHEWADAWLAEHGIAPNALVVIHPGTAGPSKLWFAGGWAAVAREFPIAALLAPAGSPAPGIANCVAGQSWEWDGVRFRMLHPTPGFPYLGNEASCVLRIETARGSALLTGDIGHYVERALLRREGARLRNQVVIVPHHGSAGSSDPGFIDATRAQLAVVSSGAGNRFGHPKPQVVRRWCDAGAEVLDTARSGAVRIWLGRNGLQADERRASRPRLWDAARRRHAAAGLCYAPE